MTAKEKAQELVIGMKIDYTVPYIIAKQCALIAVDELIYSHSQDTTDNQFYFLQEVKQEIINL
jgi:hypothetical protein